MQDSTHLVSMMSKTCPAKSRTGSTAKSDASANKHKTAQERKDSVERKNQSKHDDHHQNPTAYKAPAQHLQYAASANDVRPASYAHRGGVDRGRGEPRCAASRPMQAARCSSHDGLLLRDSVWARARSQLCRQKAGRGRALIPMCLRAYRRPPVQSRSGAHSAKPLPSCCSLRGAATGDLKCV